MKKIVCKKCGCKLDKDAKFCDRCGCKVDKGNDLDEKEVAKNVFGLLSMFTFLLSIVLFTVLPMILNVFNVSIELLNNLSYVGFGLAIIFEIIGLIIVKKDQSIDMQASGLNYGSAAMAFSFFMIIAKVAGMY